MGAAAGAAVAAGFHQPHGAVQLLFAAVLGGGQGGGVGDVAVHGGVGPHGGVGFGFGPGQLGGGKRDAGVHPHVGGADVEAHILGPEQAVEGAAEDMLAGVLLHGIQAAGPIDAAGHSGARLQRSVRGMGDGGAVGMHVGHLRSAQRAQVTGLAAALREEGSPVQHDRIAALGRGAGKHGCSKFLHISVCFV